MTTAELTRTPSDTATSSLQMIQADLDIRKFHRWAGIRGLISRAAFDEGYAMHCLLFESFGELAPKPYRIIIPRNHHSKYGTLYGYTRCTVEDLHDAAAACADPQQAKILPSSSFDSKTMPTAWQPGRRLGFEALVRPVKRLSRCVNVRSQKGGYKARNCESGCNNRGCSFARDKKVCSIGCAQRHSIIERDAFQAVSEQFPRGEMHLNREEVYADWLKHRLEARGAAQIDSAKLAMFQRTRATRKLHAPPSEGPHALMRGTLTIADAEAFANLLANGIGRHKAYGYGMLLLRPPINTRIQ